MVFRNKTIEYAFDTRTTSLSAASRHDFSEITLEIPENIARTFRNVYVEIQLRGNETSATSMTSWLIGVKLGSVDFDDVTVTSTLTNTGDQQNHRFTRNLTSYFVTNFGTGTSQTCQIGVQFGALAVINVTAKLVITYDFDDDNQSTRVKTVRIPIESPTSTLTDTLAEIGTNQVPILTGGSGILPENSISVKDLFFEIMANESHASGTTDNQLGVSLDAESEVLFGSLEQALSSSPYAYVIWRRTDMDTTATHAFKARGTVTGHFTNLCAVLVVTYTYNHDASTTIFNSLEIPFKSELASFGGTDAADTSRTKTTFLIEEPTTITLRQSAIFFQYSAANITSIAGLNLKVGEQTFRAYTPINAVGAGVGKFSIMHRFDSGGSAGTGLTPARGENSITFDWYRTSTSNNSIGYGPTAVAILNYTSGKQPAGDGTHNHTTKWLINSTNAIDNGIRESAAFAPHIPETNYWVNDIGYEFILMISGRNFGFLSAEVLSGETKENGWETVVVMTKGTANELEIASPIMSAGHLFKQHAQDESSLMAIEDSRKYRVNVPQNANSENSGWSSSIMILNTHSSTYTVNKKVSGYSGDGYDIPVSIYRDDTKELLCTVNTMEDGYYSFVAYDNTVTLFAEAREDDTHVGRSANFIPGDPDPSPFSPSDLEGLVLWLRGDAVTLNSTTVSSWTDKSNNGFHATNGTGSTQPLWDESVAELNDQPAVYFDGTDNVLTLPDLGVTTEVDIILIAKLDSASPGSTTSGLWHLGTHTGISTVYPWTDGHIYDGAGRTDRPDLGLVSGFSPVPDLAACHSYMIRSADGSYVARINGNQIYSSGTCTFGMPSAPTLGKSAGSIFLKGYMAELIIVSPRLSSDDLDSLSDYLMDRYGVAC